MTTNRIISTFEPVIDSKSKIIILGSFPSIASRKQGYFYMNPANRFWRLLSSLLNSDFAGANITEKRKLLLKHHIALYDVINECNIVNSDDNKISDEIINDIPALIANTKVSVIFCNGRKAYNLFTKYFPQLTLPVIYLPSSSPANAKMPLELLLTHWQIINDYL